uniref:Uncharacterized protein n=1 Tax=Vitis vinifera TaxID=29760 RepID=F6GU41_VITVI
MCKYIKKKSLTAHSQTNHTNALLN